MKQNEMHLLGDALLATTPPLTFSVTMDRDRERVVDQAHDSETRRLTIGSVELLSAGNVITDAGEKNLAWFLMLHGGWNASEQKEFDANGRVEKLVYTFTPDTPNEDADREIEQQGFAVLGAMSRLYTLRFLEATTTEGGDIRALREEPVPALLARLVPAEYWEREHVLPIWRLEVRPAH
ncbi:hypothetical protein [Actinacidiphila alni]|uniref:hypothetical protein n=1 Tax=Actinacidiphila alni TaxID=380248 RepID=UPI001160B9C8|nr:hypothetical protein [Actinacidiphila alni]